MISCAPAVWVWLWVTGCAPYAHVGPSVCVLCLKGTQCNGNIVLNVCAGCVCVCVYSLFGPMRLCSCVAPVVLLESMVTSAGVSKWQGLFVGVVICFEKSGTDSWWRQQEGATTSLPPTPTTPQPPHKMSSLPWLAHPTIPMKRTDI